MEEEIKLVCDTCDNTYQKPAIYLEYNKEFPNIFWKENLTYCDSCRKAKTQNALKNLGKIIDILTNKNDEINTREN